MPYDVAVISYVFQNGVVNDTIASAKQNSDYSSKIQENFGNTGIIFKTGEKFLNYYPAQRYPPGTDNSSESFIDFFTNKIVRIRNDLDTFSRISNDSLVTPCSTRTESCLASQLLDEFRLVDEEVIYGYVSNLCTKSWNFDPIPLSVFQRCQHLLLPIITGIVNLSLQGGQVPDRFKVGVIKPLLKKNGADHENFSKFSASIKMLSQH